jgi:hypothetical protein
MSFLTSASLCPAPIIGITDECRSFIVEEEFEASNLDALLLMPVINSFVTSGSFSVNISILK